MMARSDYIIPVKIRLEQGRFRHGYVKKLPATDDEMIRVLHASGRITTRIGRSIIHEPMGFEKQS